MRRLIAAILFFCFLAISTDGLAQETLKAKKMEGQTWHQIVMVKFEPGSMDKAEQIINDHFAKAGEASGVPGPKIMKFQTGEWDMMFVWKMDSISDMEWEISPDDEKWWDEMVKQEGGEEEAMKIWQDYLSLIESSTSYLATSQEPMEGDTMGSNN